MRRKGREEEEDPWNNFCAIEEQAVIEEEDAKRGICDVQSAHADEAQRGCLELGELPWGEEEFMREGSLDLEKISPEGLTRRRYTQPGRKSLPT